MRKALLVSLVAALLASADSRTTAQSRVGLALAPGDKAPALFAPILQGGYFTARWSRADVTIVNFWATWCEPCRMEMPSLQKLRSEHAAERLTVVGVLLDPAPDENALEFAAALGVDYTLVRGGSALANQWGGIAVLPTTFVIDRAGKIRRRFVGGAPDKLQALVSDVEGLLAAAEADKGPAPKR